MLAVFEKRLHEVVVAFVDAGEGASHTVSHCKDGAVEALEMESPQLVVHSRFVVLRSHLGATSRPLWLVHALSGSVEPVRGWRIHTPDIFVCFHCPSMPTADHLVAAAAAAAAEPTGGEPAWVEYTGGSAGGSAEVKHGEER